ncbi:CU044_5270 family protein [Virgisporangium ochraceum]|uniref:CU044_5270 family protein n=1 Tax=Virgisporangium ochraceum TaxID=65505 RepID=A0A8J3ZXX7_9ACTN|nr:CU044_5270 family protein [Virgisporangium ochraceum]GIJ72137.1 hypothetical protein Voc01_070540 [Virgisporangium ochraceum]
MSPNDREELARLVPAPVERDLPGDRHHQLEEFLMSEIRRTRPAQARRSVLVTSAVTAVAAVAAAVGVGVAVAGQPRDGRVAPGPAPLSGQQLLLAAADAAQRQPEGTGTYWHVTIVAKDGTGSATDRWETWADRDGANWVRFPGGIPDPSVSGKRIHTPVRWGDRGFSLCGPDITFAELQGLPTTPDALTAAVSAILDRAETLAAPERRRRVLYGLIALVSQLPAPPKVRAAAFQAIAAYPDVVNAGPVDGGQALRIPIHEGAQARVVIDPVAARIRETDFLVLGDFTLYATDGGSSTVTAGWTDSLPA